MPGFVFCGSGAADAVNGLIETRRKYRWKFTLLGQGASAFSQDSLLILQSASRPKFKFNLSEMHHMQEIARFAGKHEWDPVTLKWYDAEQPDVSGSVWKWLGTVVDLTNANVGAVSTYKSDAKLSMQNGVGADTERWKLCGAWPAEVNWGELDYGSSDIAMIEATVRYDRAIRECFSAPGAAAVNPPC